MNVLKAVIGFFKSSAGKKILQLAEKILKLYIGPAAKNLLIIAKEEVAAAQLTGLPGHEKRVLAYKKIKERALAEIGDAWDKSIDAAIDGALTLAVLALKSK